MKVEEMGDSAKMGDHRYKGKIDTLDETMVRRGTHAPDVLYGVVFFWVQVD